MKSNCTHTRKWEDIEELKDTIQWRNNQQKLAAHHNAVFHDMMDEHRRIKEEGWWKKREVKRKKTRAELRMALHGTSTKSIQY
jgi:hypothetical protein